MLQIALMVALSLALYGWLLRGKYGNLQIMLLVGIIVGGGLRSISTFMQRLLTPSEFDILTARMFGSISNADASYLPIASPLMLGAGGLLWVQSRRLNVMSLGRDAAVGLGLNYKAELMKTLFLVSLLVNLALRYYRRYKKSPGDVKTLVHLVEKDKVDPSLTKIVCRN